jgi:phosphoribosylformylglycinamidine (FGAM) synthase-like amidotransferase family enzyme
LEGIFSRETNIQYQDVVLKETLFLVKVGGFSYSDVMLMPTSTRKYFINKLLPKEE